MQPYRSFLLTILYYLLQLYLSGLLLSRVYSVRRQLTVIVRVVCSQAFRCGDVAQSDDLVLGDYLAIQGNLPPSIGNTVVLGYQRLSWDRTHIL